MATQPNSKEKILIVEDQFIEANDIRIMLEREGYVVCGIARSVEKAIEIIEKERPVLVLIDIFLKGPSTGIDLAKYLRKLGVAFIYISANSNQKVLEQAKATQPYGFLVKPFREKDLLVTLEIARYRHDNSMEAAMRKELKLEKILSGIIAENISVNEKLLKVCKGLNDYIPFDYVVCGFPPKAEGEHNIVSFLRIGFDEYQTIGINELQVITNLKLSEINDLEKKTRRDNVPVYYSEDDFRRIIRTPSLKKLFADTFKVESNLVLPVMLANDELFYFFFYSRRPDTYEPQHIALANRLIQPLSASLDCLFDITVKEKKIVLSGGKNIPAQVAQENIFEGIVGNSHLLLNVFDYITQVAPVDTSVLILGESGTGKERIADSIHKLSPRAKRPFIKINCAALPASLIESELFGHEKGAFTGAADKRVGKFEQADTGTLFLDEIGELPLELQAKLLRVLQEKEIERVGGRQPIKTDVRIIAATNCNLEKEIGEGRFRLDLYYRLNVFPVHMPALRDRKEDIPELVNHFIKLSNKKSGREVKEVAPQVMQQLLSYNWPGNIRELENIIERSVLLSKSDTIGQIMQLGHEHNNNGMYNSVYNTTTMQIKSIQENERDHIIAVLKKCNGKIWGVGGAAELLNVPPTTLNSKMKKLGINRNYL